MGGLKRPKSFLGVFGNPNLNRPTLTRLNEIDHFPIPLKRASRYKQASL